jgi:hypothetical protein
VTILFKSQGGQIRDSQSIALIFSRQWVCQCMPFGFSGKVLKTVKKCQGVVGNNCGN